MSEGYGGFPAAPTAAPVQAAATVMQQSNGANANGGRRLNLGAKDPLLHKAHAKVGKTAFNKENVSTPPAQRIFQLTVLTFVPFIVFATMMFTTMYMFYASPTGVLLAFCVIAGLCIMQFLVVDHCTRAPAKKWKKWIGAFGLLCVCKGLLAGLGIHYEYMLFHAKYTNMMKYTNVAASQPALQFEDAGSLLFTEGTTVDRTRAVGYRNIRTSQTMCVAPVVDGQMASTDPIVFFAVGLNCCGWRASFHCDDASKSGTRGGLLMLEPNQLVSPAMEWVVADEFNFKAFEDAIDLQKSVFAVSAAKNHRMLRWVEDPLAEIDHYRKRGLESAIICCVIFFCVAAILIVRDVVSEGARQRQLAQQLMKTGGV